MNYVLIVVALLYYLFIFVSILFLLLLLLLLLFVAVVIVVVVVAVLVVLKPALLLLLLLLLSFVFLLIMISILFCFLLLLLLLLSAVVVVVVAAAVVVVSLALSLLSFVFRRFYPLKRFRVASPSCVLEKKLLLIYSFYKGDSLSFYFVFMLFYSPANTSGFRPSCLSVQDVFIHEYSFLLFFWPPEAFSSGFLLLVCWRRRVYSFLHGLRERGVLGGGGGGAAPPTICNEGALEEGFEGDFARDFLLRAGEDISLLSQ